MQNIFREMLPYCVQTVSRKWHNDMLEKSNCDTNKINLLKYGTFYLVVLFVASKPVDGLCPNLGGSQVSG